MWGNDSFGEFWGNLSVFGGNLGNLYEITQYFNDFLMPNMHYVSNGLENEKYIKASLGGAVSKAIPQTRLN